LGDEDHLARGDALMTHPLLDRLAAGPLLADGAMGTVLYASGASLDESFDALNLTRPELVLDVHRAYLEAGADLLETNSFGANRFKLDGFGLGAKVREINKTAVRLAREAREISGRPVLIGGSVGPTGRTLAPFGAVHLTRPDCERMLGAPNDRARFLVPRMILLVLQWDSARS
jgi:methionine synthase I (cobalamin-dependent)